MSKHVMFIGDPGKGAGQLLEALRNVGLSAKRQDTTIEKNESFVRTTNLLAADPPVAILFNGALKQLKEEVAAVRADSKVSGIPILLQVKSLDPEFLIEAFKWGVDDFFVENAVGHFTALVSAIEKQDTWKTVRAPAGRIILAHADRLERAKFGRILRRNGFDTYFAGNSEELDDAIRGQQARAVIVSCDIPGKPVIELLSQIAGELSGVPPFIIVAKTEGLEQIRTSLPGGIKAMLFEKGEDAEGVTFLLNELLAPPPLGSRRSTRILYGTPVSFVHQGGETFTTGFSFNINLGGIYVRTLASLPLQTKIEVRFRPPFGRGEIFADAQVVWRKQLGDDGAASPPGMGVQFLNLWPADLAAYETGYQQLLETSTSIPESPST